MPIVQVEEQDYDDNPDGDGFPEIIAENLPHQNLSSSPKSTESQKSSFLLSMFQQQQQQHQEGRQQTGHQSDKNGNAVGNGSAITTSSSTNHFNRLIKSSTQAAPNGISTTSSPVSTDELNDTIHFVKGKGVLASMKDVNVSPTGKLLFVK